MKITLFLLLFLTLFPVNVFAVTTSATATPTKSPATADSKSGSDSAKDLVNKITDKVSQMGQSLKKAYSGKIRSLGNNSISLTYDQGEAFVETNDATNFYRVRTGQQTTIDFKSLKIGNEITVIGIFDEGAKTLVARTLIDKIRRYAVFGKVTNIQKDIFTLTLPDGSAKIIDLTDTSIFKKINLKFDLVNAKQSEIAVGDSLSVVGYYSDGDTNLSGLKVLLFPQGILNPSPTPEATASGKVKS